MPLAQRTVVLAIVTRQEVFAAVANSAMLTVTIHNVSHYKSTQSIAYHVLYD
jgi:hypothetical protein